MSNTLQDNNQKFLKCPLSLLKIRFFLMCELINIALSKKKKKSNITGRKKKLLNKNIVKINFIVAF